MNEQKNATLTLPGAIIIAAAIIGISIIWVKKPVDTVKRNSVTDSAATAQKINLAPVTASDHIYGNPNAPIKIVEFSDPSCPFCKSFDSTMWQIMSTYGPSGKVAWIYRAYPLDKPDPQGRILHPNAGHESQALECVASLGGNDKFWRFEKLLYETTPSVTAQSPSGLDQKKLPEMAKAVGVDVLAFNDCLSSGEFKSKIDAQYTDGVNAGVTGTPHSIVITQNGNKVPLSGAMSFTNLKQIIDAILADQNSGS